MDNKCENTNCKCDGKYKVCRCREFAAIAGQSKIEEKRSKGLQNECEE